MTTDPQPLEVEAQRRPLTWAVVASATVGAGILWLVLSIATGLIFHFMPGAPMIVAIWVRRSYGPDRPLGSPSLAAHIAGGIGVTAATAAVIATAGGSLDALWLMVVVTIVGTAIAIWLGRRGPA